ncbi:MAG: hypothetical protein D6718_03425 [Acidobacteria bacterium]|nr:MAG: hypothetical protein D6718_03425 [Acidobacteriota bacterium]
MRGVRRALALAAALAAGAAVAGESPAELQSRLIDASFDPAAPEELEKFLEIRKALQPYYKEHSFDLTQWALREAGTIPMWGSLLRVTVMRKKLDELLEQHGLSFEQYMRLTFLVYGRWLRAVSDRPSPEAKLVRELAELAVGLQRHLANNPPEDPKARDRLQERLAAVRHQIAFVAPFAYETAAQKKAVLDRLDPATVAWLEEHREEIERCDFGVFDTAPPPRDKGPARGREEPAPAS